MYKGIINYRRKRLGYSGSCEEVFTTEATEFGEFSSQELFYSAPSAGAISEYCFTGKPEEPI
jgi:hypothetical protein